MLRGPSGEAEETMKQWEGCLGQQGPLLGGTFAADRNRIFWLSSFQFHSCTDLRFRKEEPLVPRLLLMERSGKHTVGLTQG